MRYAGTDRDDQDPWFRIKSVDVTTTIFFLGVWVLSVLLYIVDRTLFSDLALAADPVLSGEVWRLVTWPLAVPEFTLWMVINAAIFWFFSTDIERSLGRKSMAILLGGSVLIISFFATLFGALVDGGAVIYGFDLIALTVVLLFIAERPTVRFFFNIPAWAIGAVIVALEVVNDLAERDWVRLLTVIAAAGGIALLARSLGWLSDHDRIPELHLPSRKPKAKADGPSRKTRRAAKRSGLSEVVSTEPTPAELRSTAPGARRPQPRPVEVQSADDVALDLLLDKISASGIDSLTADERRELDQIQARRKPRR